MATLVMKRIIPPPLKVINVEDVSISSVGRTATFFRCLLKHLRYVLKRFLTLKKISEADNCCYKWYKGID